MYPDDRHHLNSEAAFSMPKFVKEYKAAKPAGKKKPLQAYSLQGLKCPGMESNHHGPTAVGAHAP